MLASLVTTAASAAIPFSVPPRFRGGRMYRDLLARHKADSPGSERETQNVFAQLRNHSDPSAGTFQQRWWSSFAHSDNRSDVAILYVEGEAPAGGSPGGFVVNLAKEWAAPLLNLEHRFYGDSMPAPLTDANGMRLLSVEQALADLTAFMEFAAASVLPKPPFGVPLKWIIVGGSYAGAVAAWHRVAYPKATTAAWSSSGVVAAVYSFPEFDRLVKAALPEACGAAVRAVTDAFDAAWDAPGGRNATLQKFGVDDWAKYPAGAVGGADFAWMLADAAAMAPQYGMKDALCDAMVPVQQDVLAQFAAWVSDFYGPSFPSNCYYSTACLASPRYSPQWAAGSYSWVYQCCAELAYWQVGDFPGALRSARLTTAHFDAQCEAAFARRPDPAAFNQRFGGFTPPTDAVFASNFGDDPWRGAAVNTSRPRYPEVTAVCRNCAHCDDLGTPSSSDPAELTALRMAGAKAVAGWVGASGRRQ